MSKTVCVTGAAGFVASQLVKLLLEKGYTVHGTVRDPSNKEALEHLTSLKNASTHLKLFHADLLQPGSFAEAIKGCSAVFHTASPVIFKFKDPHNEVIRPAVEGTLNVLKTCEEAESVNSVVVTSSIAAVIAKQVEPGHVWSNQDWSDTELLEKISNWYFLSKTLAEKKVWEWQKNLKRNIKVATIAPPYIIGPPLQKNVNASIEFVLPWITGKKDKINNDRAFFADVRDVANAHLQVFEQGAEGRFLTIGYSVHYQDLCELLRKHFPSKTDLIPSQLEFEPEQKIPALQFTQENLTKLGVTFIDFESSLVETIKTSSEKGFL